MREPLVRDDPRGWLDIQMLGGFSIQIAGEPILDSSWHSRRARSLLKLLALAPDHRLSHEQVEEALWPSSDLNSADNNFHQTIHAARRVLSSFGVDCLVLENRQLQLRCPKGCGLRIDAEEFEAAANAIDTRESSDCGAYSNALALYRGDLLPDDLYEEWTLAPRENLKQVYLHLLLGLARLHARRQDYPAGIDVLQLVLLKDACHEEAHLELMRLYELNGQRVQALRQYQTLTDILAKELELEPSEESRQLYRLIRGGELQPRRPGERPRTNLPIALTSFIGRENEIGQIQELIIAEGARLLTLTGAGGTGKTRLALQAVKALLGAFPDGVWLVELAPLNVPHLVPGTLASALGLREEQDRPILTVMLDHLSDRRTLIVLDNCEHLIEAVAELVERILRQCPQVTILSTSREILGVEGEIRLRCPSLTLPAPTAASLAAIESSEAVRLFAERAARTSPGFTLNAQNAAAVAQICARLDGIPLAIELAAARLRLLSVEQIAERLSQSFHLLNSANRMRIPRHQTLAAAIEWSYTLLTEKECWLLRRLSVFRSGWTLAAAEAVCAFRGDQGTELQERDILDLLGRLADKSLILADTGRRETRYSMLEIIREHAAEHLEEMGEEGLARSRHLTFFLDLAEQAEPHLRAFQAPEWLKRLDQELGNLRYALDWSYSHAVELGMRLAVALFWFYYTRRHYSEGLEACDHLLALEKARQSAAFPAPERTLAETILHGRTLLAAGLLGTFSLDIEFRPPYDQKVLQACDIFSQTGAAGQKYLPLAMFWSKDCLHYVNNPIDNLLIIRDLALQNRDDFCAAEAYMRISQHHWHRGDLPGAIRYAEKSLELHQKIGDHDGIGWNFHQLAYMEFLQGHRTRALELLGNCRSNFETVGNEEYSQFSYSVNIDMALDAGDYDHALRMGITMLTEGWTLGSRLLMGWGVYYIFYAAWTLGDADLAARHCQEVLGPAWAKKTEKTLPFLNYENLGRIALSKGEYAQAGMFLKYPENYTQARQVVGVLAVKVGEYRKAVILYSTLKQLYPWIENNITPIEKEAGQCALQTARHALSEVEYQAAWNEGQQMGYEQNNELIREICAIAEKSSTAPPSEICLRVAGG